MLSPSFSSINKETVMNLESARETFHEVKAALTLDTSRLVEMLRSQMERKLALRSIALEPDLARKRATPMPLWTVSTWAFEADKLRKIVLSDIQLRPLVSGLALFLVPKTNYNLPIFGADLMSVPGKVHASFDFLSPNFSDLGYRDYHGAALTGLRSQISSLSPATGPEWA